MADASSVPVEIQAMVTAGALFVANHSGGKDSQAMLVKLLEFVPPAWLQPIN